MQNSSNLSKSYKEIIKQHVFTLFNGINNIGYIRIFYGFLSQHAFYDHRYFKYADWTLSRNTI